MEHLEFAIEDPLIKSFLAKFPRKEWDEVIRETLKLGIHSMNTVRSLNMFNGSPEKYLNNVEFDGGHEDDSTVLLADSLLKIEGATQSSKENTTKILRNDSKLPIRKKKSSSQVNKTKVLRITPKARKGGFELLRNKKETKRIHSVKGKPKNETVKFVFKENEAASLETKKRFRFEEKDLNSAKSFKNLKGRVLELQLSPHGLKLSPKNVKGSLGVNDFNDFYRNNMSCKNQQVKFPLKVKRNIDVDPFVYVTSSSEESLS